jgi:hypothetical protein
MNSSVTVEKSIFASTRKNMSQQLNNPLRKPVYPGKSKKILIQPARAAIVG